MTLKEKIENRTLSLNDIKKIEALAGTVVPTNSPKMETITDEGELITEDVKLTKQEDDTEYLAGLVNKFYKYFNKGKTKKDAGTLTLSACVLKANAVVAQMIKEK